MTTLTIDIGGTHLKMLASNQTEPRQAPSGAQFTPTRMVELVNRLIEGWDFQAITIGYPGQVGSGGPRSEPGNLGSGWVGYNYAAAFDRPVKVINDAAKQALGSYEGGRMLFLGLGTGLGSTLISEQVEVPLELGRITCEGGVPLGDVLGRTGLERLGESGWRDRVFQAAASLMDAFLADYIVLGGGNASRLDDLPHGMRLGHNLTAFRGGFRLWNMEGIPPLSDPGDVQQSPQDQSVWRLI
jgi:polyphosphate glucokinase